MKKMFIVLALILIPHSAAAGEMKVNMPLNSFGIFEAIYGACVMYFNSAHKLMIESGVLPTLSGTIFCFTLVFLSFKIYKEGFGGDVIVESFKALGIAIVCVGIVNSTALMNSIFIDFAVRFPLKIASFFITVLQKGAIQDVDSVKELFNNLDKIFLMIIQFCWKMFPTESIYNLGGLILKLVILGVLLIVYFTMYFAFFATMLLSVIAIFLCAIISPFLGVLAIFPWTRGFLSSLIKTIFYHWLVIIINAVVISLFITILGGLADKFALITDNNHLLADPLYLIMLLVLLFAKKAIKMVNSFVSQITEIRGVAGDHGGGGMLGGIGGAAIAMSGKAGLMKIASKMAGKAGANSFKDKQMNKRSS